MLRLLPALRQVLTAFCLIAVSFPAAAHQLRPALAEIDFSDSGARWSIVFSQINLEAIIADIGPDHDNTDNSPKRPIYEALRSMAPEDLVAAFNSFAPTFLDGIELRAGETRLPAEVITVIAPPVGDKAILRDSVVTIGGAVPDGVREVTFAWSSRFNDVVFRTVAREGDPGYSAFLTGGDASGPVPVIGAASQTAVEAFAQYVVVGFDHILPLGLDHILFVIGLFLLSTRLRPLLIQVTCFTAAHTITLALGILGVVNVPGEIVEPLIALSIAYIAIENMLSDKMTAVRPALVIFFGLLHGLGFAGVLSEFGLAPGQFAVSLIAFNIGVEIGQLAVIAACYLAVGLWFGERSWYRRAIVAPASLAIGAYGLAWFAERAGDLSLNMAILVAMAIVLGAALMTIRGWRGQLSGNLAVIALGAVLTVGLRYVETSIA